MIRLIRHLGRITVTATDRYRIYQGSPTRSIRFHLLCSPNRYTLLFLVSYTWSLYSVTSSNALPSWARVLHLSYTELHPFHLTKNRSPCLFTIRLTTYNFRISVSSSIYIELGCSGVGRLYRSGPTGVSSSIIMLKIGYIR